MVAIASYEKPEHRQQVMQIKGVGGTYVTESLDIVCEPHIYSMPHPQSNSELGPVW